MKDCLFFKKIVTTLFLAILCVAISIVSTSAMGLSFGDIESNEPDIPSLNLTPGPLKAPLKIDLLLAKKDEKTLLVTDYFQNSVFVANLDSPDVVSPLFEVEGKLVSLASYKNSIFLGYLDDGRIERVWLDGKKKRALKVDDKIAPYDMVVDVEKDWLFVADGVGKQILAYNLAGKKIHTIQGFGDIHNPRGLSVSPQREVVVMSDAGNPLVNTSASIQAYDYSGHLLWKKSGTFSAPKGMAIYNDHLFVVDSVLGQIMVFDLVNGSKLDTISGFGTDPDKLFMPMDIVIDEDTETLFVTNYRQGRISVFSLGGN